MASAKNSVIERRAYARVGLLGNPSDVYYGRTISISLGNFWASVKLEPSDNLMILPHPAHDLVQFDSLPHLVRFHSTISVFLMFLFSYFWEIWALIWYCVLVRVWKCWGFLKSYHFVNIFCFWFESCLWTKVNRMALVVDADCLEILWSGLDLLLMQIWIRVIKFFCWN